MKGFMRQRGKAWELRVYLGRDPETGKRRYASKTVRGSKREAQSALAAMVAAADQGAVSRARGTVGELLERWFEHAAPDFSPKTALETRGVLDRYLVPDLGEVSLAKLRADDLDRYYRRLRERGRSGRPLAPATIKRIHGILRRALSQGVRWGWLATNPAASATPPRVPVSEINPPSPSQLAKLFATAVETDPELVTFIVMAAATGARRSELVALRWSDVDLATGSVTIARAIVAGPDGIVEKDTKIHSSRRVALDASTVETLNRHRLVADERAAVCGVKLPARLALALGVSADFFEERHQVGCLEIGCAFFRSRRSATQAERRAAIAQASVIHDAVTVIERHVDLPALNLPRALTTLRLSRPEVEEVAARVRSDWELPDGPVAHVVRLLEANGAIVSRLHIGTSRVDAFSIDTAHRPIVVLAADKDDAARSRFDAAHELGHLVMHGGEEPGDPALEQEANWFAAALLLPADEIRDELPSKVQWPAMIKLRQRWGVSLAMLLMRARTLGVVSDDAYRRNVVRMSANGWQRREPGDIGPAEQPVLLGKALDVMCELGWTLDPFATALRLPRDVVEAALGLSERRRAVSLV